MKFNSRLDSMVWNPNTKMATFLLKDSPVSLIQQMSKQRYDNLQSWILPDIWYEWIANSKTNVLREGPYPINENHCYIQ